MPEAIWDTCEHDWEQLEGEEDFNVSSCILCQSSKFVDLKNGTTEIEPPIHCYKCKSTNWECWDERSFWCWDRDGYQCGEKIVGYLRCKDCDTRWSDVSVDPSGDDCECEDD